MACVAEVLVPPLALVLVPPLALVLPSPLALPLALPLASAPVWVLPSRLQPSPRLSPVPCPWAQQLLQPSLSELVLAS
jgi:hypothetical protein